MRSAPAATIRKRPAATLPGSRQRLLKVLQWQPADPSMRILVVEDEPVAATVLAKGLREHAYAVDVAGDGPAAFEQATVNDYDLMIVDVLLPGMSGLDLCGRLRADGVTAPILMLTARGEPDHRVEGLDAGADDYL